MCGIVGYIGEKNAIPLLLEGLKHLAYRGYDSAGIAAFGAKQIEVRRCAGKVGQLEEIIKKNPLAGNVALAHTRWATHGIPSEENAHPHLDCQKKIVIVHNGIIENYVELKKKLIKEGHKFSSQTDSEVVVHLIEKYKDKGLFLAVETALKEIEGSYALGIISLDEPDKIVCARKDSPLIIGIGEKEYFIASDVPAILGFTRQVIYLENKDIGVITKEGITIYNQGRKVVPKISTILWDPLLAEKGGYKHFMLKEIFEQPQAIQDTMRGRVNLEKGEIYLDTLSLDILKKIKRISIIACGTAYYAGMVGKIILEEFAKIPVEVDIASEFRYRQPLIDEETLCIAISQSGETADTLAALREAKKCKGLTIGICNVVGSTLTREVDGVIYTHAGPEIGVASTKAFTSQITILILFAFYFGKLKGIISNEEIKNLLKEFLRVPAEMQKILENSQEKIEEIAHKFFKKEHFLYLGRYINYPIALEGALKLKEISYIHAEGYPAGEMKHGPIALIDENMPVVIIANQGRVYDKVLSNAEEVKTRGGIIIALATQNDKKIKNFTTEIMFVPEINEIFSCILNVVYLQLLAYNIAVLRGCDVDQPRNLAKSVTVE